jgi:hypothetical protein
VNSLRTTRCNTSREHLLLAVLLSQWSRHLKTWARFADALLNGRIVQPAHIPMDRREAIKKLAAGSALAAGGSMVLSSRDVAYAASTPGTGLFDVPGPTDNLPVTLNSSGGIMTLSDPSNPTCTPGSLDRSYSWKINQLHLWKRSGTLEIRNSTNTETIRDGVGGYSAPNPNHGTVTLRKMSESGQPEDLRKADKFEIELLVTWRCSGAGCYVRAEYVFDLKYDKWPRIDVGSYAVV